MKAFYCGGTSSNYSTPVQFTTADPCPDMTNLTATTFNGNQAKVDLIGILQEYILLQEYY